MPDAQSVSENDKITAERFHLDMIAKGQIDIADEIIAPDCIIHSPMTGVGNTRGPERARQMAIMDAKIYPKGIKITHNIVIGEKDFVAFQWTIAATRENGEVDRLQGIDMVRMKNGKAVEMWIEYHDISKENPNWKPNTE